MGSVRRRRYQGGFTLMEMLIAIGITAFIGIGVWQVVSGVTQSRDRVDEAAAAFSNLQKTMTLLERDLGQVVNRPVRNLYGDEEAAFSSKLEGWLFVLTRQGWRNPTGARRSELQRVAWELTGDELRRRYWTMLDQAQDAQGRDQLLLTGVANLEIRFRSAAGNWVNAWPVRAGSAEASGTSIEDQPLPSAVELTIEHDTFGDIRRLFVLPDFNGGSVQSDLDSEQNEPESEEPSES